MKKIKISPFKCPLCNEIWLCADTDSGLFFFLCPDCGHIEYTYEPEGMLYLGVLNEEPYITKRFLHYVEDTKRLIKKVDEFVDEAWIGGNIINILRDYPEFQNIASKAISRIIEDCKNGK